MRKTKLKPDDLLFDLGETKKPSSGKLYLEVRQRKFSIEIGLKYTIITETMSRRTYESKNILRPFWMKTEEIEGHPKGKGYCLRAEILKRLEEG